MAASPSPSPDVEGVAIGSVLDGRYRIDAILGTGGMGRVYRGEHTGIGRAVAIKVLHADLNRNREAAQRFQREALASGRLDHPNIVGVSDFGVLDDGSCYLVMEVLEGESLGQRLEREKRLPWREAVEILRGVLHGLRHAHDRGVVHRDIKPDNVFLARKDGEIVVKILDFGIAKLYAGSPDDPASTRAGLTVGTPAYLSPEQAVGGDITPASDLYSSTIVLFEMLAGRTPFDDKDPLAMLGAHVSRQPPQIAELVPGTDVPAALEDVIQHGLNKLSAERYRSSVEYLAALDAVLAGAPVMPLGTAPVVAQVSAEALGVMETASFLSPASSATPARGIPRRPQTPVAEFGDESIIMTVHPGTATPIPGTYTPVPGGSPTPSPSAPAGALPAIAGAAPTAMLDTYERQQRAVSLADLSDPIPRRWIYIAGGVVAIGIVIAIVLALASGGSSSSGASGQQGGKPVLVPMAVQTVDREMLLKVAIHDLQNGKTCEDRKDAVQRLAELDDPRAIDPLRRARSRRRGGVLGIGASNTNACLKAEAEAAIKQLGGTIR